MDQFGAGKKLSFAEFVEFFFPSLNIFGKHIVVVTCLVDQNGNFTLIKIVLQYFITDSYFFIIIICINIHVDDFARHKL